MLVECLVGEPFGVVAASDVRNDGATEIHRFVAAVENDFWRVGVEERRLEVVVCAERLDQRGNLGAHLVEARLQRLDLLGVDEWLIALDIDHDIVAIADEGICLEATVGSAPMLVGGHDDVAAKGEDSLFDSPVVGGDADLVERLGYTFVNSLYHRFACHVCQRLARETGGGVARWDDSYELHIGYKLRMRFR